MELNNLNVDSMSASWFLLTLFFKTERKYTCTKVKTSQLLTIIALDYANNGDKLFDTDIFKSEDDEIYISSLVGLSKREYIGAINQNDDNQYIDADLDDSKEYLVPFVYRCNTVDENLKEKTISVFRHFGAYSQEDLATMINPILNKITNEDGMVNLTKASSIINETNEDNEVVKYLKANCINNVKTKIKRK